MAPSPFHPELRTIARVLPKGIGSPRVVKVARILGRLTSRRSGGAEVVSVGAIEVRVHRPSTTAVGPRPALLWIHGGGFVLGTAAQEDAFCRMVADRLDVIVAAVDYRLAPEFPHPTPVHDCHDALVWLAGLDDVDADRVAIGGASAGGGLAASLALLARERNEVRPAFQLLTYPMLDDRTVLVGQPDEASFRLWNSRSNRFAWTSYLGVEPGSAGVDPIAAPARHPDLDGLPPAWIGVGTLDLFHDEDVAYAERLAAATPCELTLVEGAFHAFDFVAPRSDVVRAFRDDQLGALGRALGADLRESPAHK